MDLDEWIALSPEDRNHHRRNWDPNGAGWSDLIEAACDRFRAHYADHPQVNYITHSRHFSATEEPAIWVTTALWIPQRVEDLPDRFATFAVRQEPIENNKQYYLETWRVVVGNLLGWDADQVMTWAEQQWGDYLNGKQGHIFYQDDPGHYVATLLINELLPDVMEGMELASLQQRLTVAIRGRPLSYRPYLPDEERDRVNAVLAEYETSLPEQPIIQNHD